MDEMIGILAAIFGLALLMIVHESGHHLVARAFRMRVLRFSIGFGPAIWRHQPKGSDTVCPGLAVALPASTPKSRVGKLKLVAT